MSERPRVVDASVVLRVALKQAGWEQAAELLPETTLSAVNFAEVLTVAHREDLDWQQVGAVIEEASINVAEFTATDAAVSIGVLEQDVKRRQGELPPELRGPLSLADRAAVALAMRLNGVLLTYDKAQADVALALGCDLQL